MKKMMVVMGLLLLAGCIAHANEERRAGVTKRASFDLNCASDQLRIEALSNVALGEETSWGVRGCGKQATYLFIPQSNQIVQNSEAAAAVGK